MTCRYTDIAYVQTKPKNTLNVHTVLDGSRTFLGALNKIQCYRGCGDFQSPRTGKHGLRYSEIYMSLSHNLCCSLSLFSFTSLLLRWCHLGPHFIRVTWNFSPTLRFRSRHRFCTMERRATKMAWCSLGSTTWIRPQVSQDPTKRSTWNWLVGYGPSEKPVISTKKTPFIECTIP